MTLHPIRRGPGRRPRRGHRRAGHRRRARRPRRGRPRAAHAPPHQHRRSGRRLRADRQAAARRQPLRLRRQRDRRRHRHRAARLHRASATPPPVCNVQLQLAHGTLSAQGAVPQVSDHTPMAIIGGTGAYDGARGTAFVTDTSPTVSRGGHRPEALTASTCLDRHMPVWLCSGHDRSARRAGRAEPAAHPRPAPRRGSGRSASSSTSSASASRPSRSTCGCCARPGWSRPASTPSAGSTGCGPSRCRRSTSGSSPTGRSGRRGSTPSSATSTHARLTPTGGPTMDGPGRARAAPARPLAAHASCARCPTRPRRCGGRSPSPSTSRPGSRPRSTASGRAGAPLTFRSRTRDAAGDGRRGAGLRPAVGCSSSAGATTSLPSSCAPDGGGCELTLTDRFDELGKAARDGGRLARLPRPARPPAGRHDPAWGAGERWSQVHAGYVEEFGPEAATIGPPEEVSRA